MDLSRTPNARKLSICRKYFIAGWLALPFVWAINAVWFFNDAFRKEEFEEQKAMRRYVTFSGIGSLVWIAAIVTWVVSFQLHRAEWGAFSDYISFIIPLGRA